MKREIERGAASLFIELKSGNITVAHGTDKTELLKLSRVRKGSWDKLIDCLKSTDAKSKAGFMLNAK